MYLIEKRSENLLKFNYFIINWGKNPIYLSSVPSKRLLSEHVQKYFYHPNVVSSIFY